MNAGVEVATLVVLHEGGWASNKAMRLFGIGRFRINQRKHAKYDTVYTFAIIGNFADDPVTRYVDNMLEFSIGRLGPPLI
jgi:hypothetical protein